MAKRGDQPFFSFSMPFLQDSKGLLDTKKPVAASQPSPSRASGDSRGGGPFGARDAKTGHARDSRPKDEADGRNGNGSGSTLS